MNTLVKRQTFRVDEQGNLIEVPPDTKWREAQEREQKREDVSGPEPRLHTGLYL
jgi:hypothetical protein